MNDPPWVVFICQDRDHAIQFLNAADHELTGDLSRPWCQDDDYVGRRRIAVCLEGSVYEGSPHAWVVPRRPRRDWDEGEGERRVTRTWLPGRPARPNARRRDNASDGSASLGCHVADPVIHEQEDSDGRRVVLDETGWRHVLAEHPEMAPHAGAIMATVAQPDHRENDPRPGRERFWRERFGPSRWLFVVVDFAESPARVVTAFGRRDDPPGWWTA